MNTTNERSQVTNRTTATLVGILYIIGTVAGALSLPSADYPLGKGLRGGLVRQPETKAAKYGQNCLLTWDKCDFLRRFNDSRSVFAGPVLAEVRLLFNESLRRAVIVAQDEKPRIHGSVRFQHPCEGERLWQSTECELSF